MKKLFMVLPLVFLLCLTFGCQQGEEVAEEPAVDVEADIQANKDLQDEWEAAANAYDIDKIMSFYADEAIAIPQGGPLLIGKDAIRGSLQEDFDRFTQEFEGDITDIQVSGDLAYLRGNWTVTSTPKEGGEPEIATFRWVNIFKKQPDGTWKCICDISNSEKPLPPQFLEKE